MDAGDFALGSTFDVKFTTINSSGVPTALSGGTVVIYPGNSTTEITGSPPITLTADFDSRTGLNNVRIVATSGNGFATATNYAIVLSAGTVDGTSVVGYVIGHFSIENRTAVLANVAHGGAAATITLLTPIVANVTQWLGTAVEADFLAGIPDVHVVAFDGADAPSFPPNFSALGINASGHISRVTLTDTLTTYTGNTPQTGDSFARLGAPAGASISADIATKATPAQVNTEVLDVLNVDTLIDGKTFVQATQIIAATTAGRISGAGTGTEIFLGLDEATTRVTVTCDVSGNRSDILYG